MATNLDQMIETMWHEDVAGAGLGDVEIPNGDLWDVQAQLAHLRRDAATLMKVQRDERDMLLEAASTRISCSQRWEGGIF